MPSDVLITPASSKIDFTDGSNATKRLNISGTAFSFNSNLNVLSSTSLSSAFKAEGVNGTLFEVTDDLSNSLLSVNTIGGLPVFEVFANNSIIGGQYGANDFVISGNKIGLGLSNPVNKLSVSGAVSIGASYNVAAPSNGLIVQGDVGIGVTSFAYSNANRANLEMYGSGESLLALRNSTGNSYIQKSGADFYINNTTNGFIAISNNGSERWRITNAGVFESNNAQTIRTSTGDLTLATNAGNGHIILSPHGTGNVGIGTIAPGYKLDVNGNGRVGDAFYVTTATTADAKIEIGNGRSGNGNSYIDLVGDATYTDYGLRLIRSNGGANTTSAIAHRGTGTLYITAVEAAAISLETTNTTRMTIASGGNVGIGTTNPSHPLTVSRSTQAAAYQINLNNDAGITNGNYTGIRFSQGDGGGTELGNIRLSYFTTGSTALSFGVRNASQALYIGTDGNVGINTTSPSYKLDVNGTTRFGGIVYNEAVQTDDFNYFNLQPYVESETLSTILSVSGTAPTFVTLTNTTAPFSKVMSVSAYGEALMSDYIPVQAGETIYGEIWTYRATGAAGTAGVIYCGVQRYDKDKKMIDGNGGLNTSPSGYFIASNQTIPSNSTWTKYSGTLVLPTSHTPYNTSDGGPVRYIRPYIIYNYTAGTILTYIGGWKIRKVQLTRDLGPVSINGNVGIGSDISSYSRLLLSTTSTTPTLDSTNPVDVSLIISNSDVAYGTMFATYGDGKGALQQRRTNAATYYDFSLQPHGGNIGIGTLSPTQKLDVVGSYGVAGDSSGILKIRGGLTSATQINFGVSADGGYGWIQATDVGATNNININLNPIGGNIGIGNIAPNNKLAISGSASIGSNYNTAAPTNGLIVEGSVGIGNTNPTGKLQVAGDIRTLQNGSDSIGSQLYIANAANNRAYNFQLNSAGTNLALWGYNSSNAWQNLVNFNYNGNVGIGITSPSATLHVNSTTSGATLLRADGTNGTLFSVVDDLSDSLMSVNNSAGLPVLEVFADDRVVAGQYGANDFVLVNNKLGLGTNNPQYELDIVGSGTNAAVNIITRISSTASSNTFNTASVIAFTNTTTNVNAYSYIGSRIDLGGAGDNAQSLIFATNATNTLPTEKMRIKSDGNVGIGTAAPTVLLQINTGTPTSATGGIQFGDDTGTRLYRSASGIVTCSGTIAATFSGNLTGNVTGNVTGSSGSCTGNAANVTGTVAIANGGSGQTSAQAAMNAFAGAVTAAQFLRGNGTNVVMSAIQAADVPTLNQNTTGSSGSCTGNAATATNASQLGGAVAAKYVRNDTDGTAGDIYSLVTVTKSLTLTTSWIDTGISAGSDLISGAYILTLNADNYAVGGGHYNETYAGTMYWYAGATNSTNYDEIPLHKSGHAPNNAYINLRTLRGVSGVLKLQIISSVVTSGASNYVFKFRRII